MPIQSSSRPLAETRSGPSGAASTGRGPDQNYLLAKLPRPMYELLLTDLEAVDLRAGWVLNGGSDHSEFLYFIAAGIICRIRSLESGAMSGFAVTGSEGVIGVVSFLSGVNTLGETLVLVPGHAYRLRAKRLKHEFDRCIPLQRLLLRYTQSLVVQIGQNAVCNRHHRLEQQICLLILSCLDRAASNELALTQELIANLLGVRRESITEAVGRLREAGIIDYQRGRMTVLDRPQLETRVCECYAVVKRETDRLCPGCGNPGADRVPCPRQANPGTAEPDQLSAGCQCSSSSCRVTAPL